MAGTISMTDCRLPNRLGTGGGQQHHHFRRRSRQLRRAGHRRQGHLWMGNHVLLQFGAQSPGGGGKKVGAPIQCHDSLIA